MRKFLFIFLLSVLFFSCSNITENVKIQEKTPTLKEFIVTKESDISWTKPLEEDRLTKSLYTDQENVSRDISITPDVAAVVYKNEESAIYPELKDFGSLDIQDIPSNIKVIVDDFCKSVSSDIFTFPYNCFDSNYKFNYVFFKNDLINSWNNRFNSEFPLKNPADEKENEEKSEKESENKVKQPDLFEKWILGKPFIGDEIMRQPVRFYCKQGYVDVTLYIRLENNKIYQILEGPYD